ncbi:MAG: hypothetical protein JW791_02280 [Nanoarchaeota archaeon]|nr:hypothetical protein [Nanoarchaeota archaeon]
MNILLGWIGVKDTYFSKRIKSEISFHSGLDLLSTLLQAVSDYSQALIGCNPQSITYFNQEEGKDYYNNEGISFKIARLENNDLKSIIIDKITGRTDDFIYFEDTRPLDLMKLFYEENKQLIKDRIFDIYGLTRAAQKGRFKDFFDEMALKEFKGEKNYLTTLLMMYGVRHKETGPDLFMEKELGHDFVDYEFAPGLEEPKIMLMGMINAINDLNKEVTSNGIKSTLSFISMQNAKFEKYLIIQYKTKSEFKKENDSLGLLLKVRETIDGYPLTKTIRDAEELLPKWHNERV